VSYSYDHILIVGLGKSGQATARFLLSRADVLGLKSLTLVDSADSKELTAFYTELESLNTGGVELTAHFGYEELPPRSGAARADGGALELYDLCVMTPGLAPHTALSKAAVRHSREVISEIELAYRLAPEGVIWVAITGTNGKTTTTELVRAVLSADSNSSRAVYSVGNIGTPALELLDILRSGDILVAEVSSFQAARLSSFRPAVAALLNLSSDHLDWHKDIASYAQDKCALFARSGLGDLVLAPTEEQMHLDARDVIGQALDAAATRGAEVQTLQPHPEYLPISPQQLAIQGRHNLTNACFATAIARYFAVPESDIAEGLKSFSPQPHRMQELGRYNQVLYVNDSKATNADSAMQALSGYQGLELILILGGKEKSASCADVQACLGPEYADLAKMALDRAASVLLFGHAAPRLKACFDLQAGASTAQIPVLCFESLREATCYAYQHARPQQVVLLSPANASFDEFDNFEQRGLEFARYLKELAGQVGS